MGKTGAIKAGRAFVEVFADNKKLVRGLRQAGAKLKEFGREVRNTGLAIAGLGAAIATPIALATRVFSGFDDQMRAVKGVVGATGKEFDMLTEKAKFLGRTTSYTAAQVASAMLELGRAGFSAVEINNSIAGVMNLARATGTSLPEAADISSSSLRSFGLEADQAGRVADVLTAAANNSAQTLIDLGESMKYVAPVAAEFGLSIEETSKVLGALANFGIKGSMAGTTLKQIMVQLAKPDKIADLKAMGVAATDSSGTFRNLSDILRDLGAAMEGMPNSKRLAIMADLFDQRAMAGGIKLTAAAFDRLNNAIDNAAGTAAKTAAVMDSGIGGAFRRLWSAVEGIAISVGDSLAPFLSLLADKFAEISTKIEGFISRNKILVGVVSSIAFGLIAVGGSLVAFGALVSGLGFIITKAASVFVLMGGAIKIIAAVMAFLVTPLGAVIAGLTSVTFAILKFTGAGRRAIEWLGKSFTTLYETSRDAFEGIKKALDAGQYELAAKILWLSLKKIWLDGTGALLDLWSGFTAGFRAVGTQVWSFMKSVWQSITTSLLVAWEYSLAGIKIAWSRLGSWLGTTWLVLKDTWVTICNGFSNAWAWMVAGAEGLWVGFIAILEKAWNIMQKIASPIDFDLGAANAEIDKKLREKQDEIKQRKEGKYAENDKEALEAHQKLQDEMMKSEADYLAEKQAINKKASDMIAGINQADAEAQKQIEQDRMDALAESEKKYQEQVDARAKKRAEIDAKLNEALGEVESLNKTVDDPLKSKAAKVVGATKNIDSALGKASSVGTFSGFAADRLGFSGPASKIAEATQQTAKNTKKIVDKMDRGGLAFS
jgi:TP901 family phage tail tape measure protein